MNILITHPAVVDKSSGVLSDALKCERINPYDRDLRDFRKYDLVFNYGVSASIKARSFINKPSSVKVCFDKIKTYKALQQAGIPTVFFVTKKEDVPKSWKEIISRKEAKSSRCEGMDWHFQGDALPDAEFYSEYYKHEYEFRIVVFRGKVIGRYIKEEHEDCLTLDPIYKKNMEAIDKACLDAAKALDIDFVGFDVLAKDLDNFIILEANSAPMMIDDMLKAIVKELK